MEAKALILSICQNPPENEDFFIYLANMLDKIENNGDPVDHAKKLAYLFKDRKQAIIGLRLYLEQTTASQPLHDLCMHINLSEEPLPHLRYFGEGNLRHLFSELRDLEILTTYSTQIIPQDKLESLKNKSIKEAIRLYMKEQVTKDQEALTLSKLGIDVAQLPDKEIMLLSVIKKFNQRFGRTPFDHAKELLELMRRSKNSDTHLPRFTLKIEEIGLAPGYYMTKLSDDDIRAPLIGHFFGCCQHISGVGKDCVTHAVSSEFGATYVIFKAKVSPDGETLINPWHDTPVIGSWAWADEGIGIGFDSVELSEINNTLTETEIDVFYKEYAKRMLERSSASVRKVVIGTRGKTPESLGHAPINTKHSKNLKASEGNGKHYKGYRDSGSQRILAHREFSQYYGMHVLNRDACIKEISNIDHPDVKLTLSLNWADDLKQLGLPFTPVPAWLKSIADGKIDLSSFANDPNPNLGVYVKNKGGTALFCLIPYLAQHPQYCSLIEKHLTAELCDSGSDLFSALSWSVEQEGLPISFIHSMFKVGADPNLEDVDGSNFAHRFMAHRKAEEFNPEWVTRYQLDLNHLDDQGRTPLIRYLSSNSTPEMIEVYLKHGANPHYQESNGRSFLHRLAGDNNFLAMIPYAWVERYKFDLYQPDNKQQTPFRHALMAVARYYQAHPEHSLGLFFYRAYSERLALIRSYDALKDFCIDLHEYKPDPKSSLGFVKTIRSELLIPLLDIFLEQKVDPKQYLLKGETYFSALASNILSFFQARWFQHFTLVTETDKELQFQLFFRFTLTEDSEHPREYEAFYYKLYAQQLSIRLQKEEGLSRILTWFETEYLNTYGVRTSGYLLLIWPLDAYGLETKFLMDKYYSMFGANMASQISIDSFCRLSLVATENTGLNKYCHEKKIQSPALALLKTCPSEDTQTIIENFRIAITCVFDRAESVPELLDCIESLVDIYNQASSKKKDIIDKLMLEKLDRYFFLRQNHFTVKDQLPRILSLFTRMGIYSDLATHQKAKSGSAPWAPPASILNLPNLYVDLGNDARSQLTYFLIKETISTPEEFILCLDSHQSISFKINLIANIGFSVFYHFTHINQLLPIMSYFIQIKEKTRTHLADWYTRIRPTLFGLIKNEASYRLLENFLLKDEVSAQILTAMLIRRIDSVLRTFDKLNAALPHIPSPKIDTLITMIKNKHLKDFFKLCDKYPLLKESWDISESLSYEIKKEIDKLIVKFNQKTAPPTHRGMAFVYHAQSQAKRKSHQLHQSGEVKLTLEPAKPI